ncbi:hypothetical protein [Sharpea azabuensis]
MTDVNKVAKLIDDMAELDDRSFKKALRAIKVIRRANKIVAKTIDELTPVDMDYEEVQVKSHTRNIGAKAGA